MYNEIESFDPDSRIVTHCKTPLMFFFGVNRSTAMKRQKLSLRCSALLFFLIQDHDQTLDQSTLHKLYTRVSWRLEPTPTTLQLGKDRLGEYQ